MNKLSGFSVWIVLATIMILPMSGANARPPGGVAAEFLEMQATLAEISEKMKGLLRVSSVQNVSNVQTNDDTAGIDTLEITVTTTEEGPFVIMFNAQTAVFGPIADQKEGFILTRILLDDSPLLPAPNIRTESPEFTGGNEVNWTATVANVQPGEHLVKINLTCRATFVPDTCVDLGLNVALISGAQLTVIHPM